MDISRYFDTLSDNTSRSLVPKTMQILICHHYYKTILYYRGKIFQDNVGNMKMKLRFSSHIVTHDQAPVRYRRKLAALMKRDQTRVQTLQSYMYGDP